MKKLCATVVALVMLLAFICPSVMAAPRKVTKPAQKVEMNQDQKVNASPVDKMKQEKPGVTKAKTGVAK